MSPMSTTDSSAFQSKFAMLGSMASARQKGLETEAITLATSSPE